MNDKTESAGREAGIEPDRRKCASTFSFYIQKNVLMMSNIVQQLQVALYGDIMS